MAKLQVLKGQISASLRHASSLIRERRGIAAIEFALMAPILISLYFVTLEVFQGIETNKKVDRLGAMVADLVAQQSGETSRKELEAIMHIGSVILIPYNRSAPEITVTGIRISDEGEPVGRVQWSRKLANGTFKEGNSKGTKVDVPEDLLISDTFLVRVTSDLDYRAMITWTAEQKTALGLSAAFDGITMSEVNHARPRTGKKIECKDC